MTRPSPNGRAQSGLARRHALVWSFALAIFLGTSAVVGAALAYRDTLGGIESLQQEKAVVAAERIDRFLEGIELPMRWLVRDPARTREASLAALHVELLQLMRRQPVLARLQWVDPDGRERFALSRVALDVVDGRADLSTDPRVVAARQAGSSVGSVYFEHGSEPHVDLAVAEPRSGRVLIAGVNLKSVWEIARQAQYGRTGKAYVVDAQGRLLADPDLQRVLRLTDLGALPHVRAVLAGSPARASREGTDLQGAPVLAAAAPVPRARWFVFVEQQRSEALRPVWVSLARSAVLLVAGVALAVLASVLLARRLVQPIRALQEQAARMAAGQLDRRIELRTGDELQALGEQFNTMAASLEATYTSLETRVAQRTLELAQANAAKSRFLAAASHDLRQPVHALSLFVGQLRRQGADAAQGALVQRIEDSLAAFEALLESLLDISRLDAGSVPVVRQAVDLQALLQRLSDTFAPVAQAKGLRWTLRRHDLWVESDPVLLERILLNIIGNALRYTPRGRIVLACRRRGDRVAVFVADTGIGIAEDQLPNIFREFHRAHGQDYSGEIGLGLGLAIVERLALLLGHELRVRSRRGRGSCFGVLMPRVDAPQQALPVAAPADTQVLPGRRILVVDDDESVLEATRGLLAQWGCIADVARDGASAMAALAGRGPYDLAIIDLRLGQQDGLEVAARLVAAARGGAPLAVVVSTGESDAAARLAVQAAGYPLLSKPLRPARLRALLESVLGTLGRE